MPLRLPLSLKKAISAAFLFAFVTLSPVIAQHEYFPFYSNDTTRLHNLAVSQRTSIKNHFVIPRNESADYKNRYKNIVNMTAEYGYRKVRYSALLDTIIDPYLQAIFKTITDANKDLPATKLIVTRSPVENAYALANGAIFFDIGLLTQLDNESQIAFILCHELAHVKFRHSEQTIKESLDAYFSKGFQKQVKQIAKEKYNLHSKMAAFFEETSLGSLYHKRSQEKQADSLGYMLLAKTRYNRSEAYTALQILDKIDAPSASRELNLNQLFSCADYKFDFNRNTAKASSIFAVEATKPAVAAINADTLKTHPDCQKRMRYIKELELRFTNLSAQPVLPAVKFTKVKEACKKEVVQSWFDSMNYDYALYNSLNLLSAEPENNYLKSMIVLCLYELKRHLVLHKYAEIVSSESDNHPENFNQLLRLLNSLNTSDFKGLSSCFVQATKFTGETFEYGLAAQFALAQLNNDEKAAAIKSQYLAKHKSGKFAESLFSKDLK